MSVIFTHNLWCVPWSFVSFLTENSQQFLSGTPDSGTPDSGTPDSGTPDWATEELCSVAEITDTYPVTESLLNCCNIDKLKNKVNTYLCDLNE